MSESGEASGGPVRRFRGDAGLRAWVVGGVEGSSAEELAERARRWLSDPAARSLKREGDVTIVAHPDGVFVKRYRYATLGRRLRSVGRKGRGEASLENALGLAARGFRVPRQFFVTETRRAGMMRESVLACEWIGGGRDLVDGVMRAATIGEKRSLLAEAGRLLGSMHGARVFHGDMKGSNVLVYRGPSDEGPPRLTLVDADRVVFDHEVGRGRRLKNLVQLLASFERIGRQRGISSPLSHMDRMRLLGAYLRECGPGASRLLRRDVSGLVYGRIR